MSFRAVADGVASSPNGGILPIAVWSRISPALEQDERLPQPARPFDCAQGDRSIWAPARNRYGGGMGSSRPTARGRLLCAGCGTGLPKGSPFKGSCRRRRLRGETIKFCVHPRWCTQKSNPHLSVTASPCHLPLKGEALPLSSVSLRQKIQLIIFHQGGTPT